MTDSQKWLVFVSIGGFGWLVYLLGPILTPFAVGALLAYLGDPVADKLEQWKLSRTGAVCIVFLVMTLILVAFLLLFMPMLEQQIGNLVAKLPHYVAWLKNTVMPWIQTRLGVHAGFIEVEKIFEIVKGYLPEAGKLAAGLLKSISGSGVAIAASIMNLVLIPVVAFYLLRDWDVMVAKVSDLLPRRVAPTVSRLAGESDQVLGAFLRGQLSVMIALGCIYSVGLWIIKLDLALLIGMVAGLVSFIPYLGSVVGVAAACVAAIVQFQDVWSLIPVLLVFGVGQALEGMILTPWLVGDKVGLHPVAVIFAVLAGGQLFGFLGILLALPVASVIMVLIRHVHDLYKESDLYSAESEDSKPVIMTVNKDNL